jgi:hypothetical protein
MVKELEMFGSVKGMEVSMVRREEGLHGVI